MGIPGLPAALLHQGYCSIRFKSPGSLKPGSAPQHFPLRLSISHQNGWLFLKKGHSNEFGLVGQGWPEELIDCLFTFPTNCFACLKERGSGDLSLVECYCYQSEGGSFPQLQCHIKHLVAWEQSDSCLGVAMFSYDFVEYPLLCEDTGRDNSKSVLDRSIP